MKKNEDFLTKKAGKLPKHFLILMLNNTELIILAKFIAKTNVMAKKG